jgi:AcrR family transcriptional regulator
MTQKQIEKSPKRRLGGRSARVREAVVTATVAELQESGFDKLTVSAVAARAGVHETSIYRRWKTREGLAMEATFAMFASNIAVPDKGSLIEDLTALLATAGRYLESPLGHAAMQFGLAMRHDAAVTRELHMLWANRFDAFHSVFNRAAQRGEYAATNPKLLLEALIGAVYLRVFLLREPVTPKAMRTLVVALLDRPN